MSLQEEAGSRRRQPGCIHKLEHLPIPMRWVAGIHNGQVPPSVSPNISRFTGNCQISSSKPRAALQSRVQKHTLHKERVDVAPSAVKQTIGCQANTIKKTPK